MASTTMDHSEAKELLSDYLDGELEGERKTALEAHLREDPECARELERLKNLLGSLKGLGGETPTVPPPAPAEFLGGVQAKIRRRTRGRFYSPDKMRPPWEVLLVVVGIVLAAMWILLQPGYLLPERKDPGMTATGTGAPGLPGSLGEGAIDRAAGSPGGPGATATGGPIRPVMPAGATAVPLAPATGLPAPGPTPAATSMPGATARPEPGSRAYPPVPGGGAVAVSTLPTPSGPAIVRIGTFVDKTYAIRVDADAADVAAVRGSIIAMVRAAGDKRLTIADAAGSAPLAFEVPSERFKALVDQLSKTYPVSVTSSTVTHTDRPATTLGTILVE